MQGLRALVEAARAYEADPDAFRERKFKVPGTGTEYFWTDLWTGADRDSYRRTLGRMKQQFNTEGRAYFVEGFARDPMQILEVNGWIKLRLNTDFIDSQRGEIQLHIPNTEDNRAHLAHIQWQTPLAIWSHEIYRVTAEVVLLKAPDWRNVLADGSPGMLTTPRLP